MYIPSYDFRIFDLPMFSPLQAQEFGADTMFSANTPTSFIDNSINQLSGLLDPRAAFPYVQRQFPSVVDRFGFDTYFQGASEQRAEFKRIRDEADAAFKKYGTDKLKQLRDEADRLFKQAGGEDECTEGRNILGGCGPILGSKKIKSDDSSVGTTTPSGNRIGKATVSWFKSLPSGAGTFIIAVVVIILLLLFVKK